MPASAALLPGTRLDRYVVIGQLGAGGMGEVYRAHDEQLDRAVAVKVLPATSLGDPSARARLMREARAAAALNHPNICTVYEVGEAIGQAYIAMELVEGQTLSAELARGQLSVERVVHYGRQLVDALVHAHDRGVVHRDLKSNNVVVTPEGRVKVLDFGLAKRTAEADFNTITQLQVSLTQAGTVVGTLPYMAPEQLRGEAAGVSSDLWAAGVVLYEMAAGARPFNGQTPFELTASILEGAPAPLPAHVPAPLGAVVLRCLAKDRRQRYASAADVRSALESCALATAGAQPAFAVPLPSAPTVLIRAEPSRSIAAFAPRRALPVALAAALIVLSGAGAWQLLLSHAPAQTLAVLPLENTEQDEDLEYLCEGIADSLIKQSSNLRSLRVSNLAAVLNFKRQGGDPALAGRELGVANVLAGSLRRNGAKLLVSARLLDVATGRTIWTRDYNRDAAELLDVQREIATAIVEDGLKLKLSTDDRRTLVRHPTADGDAYDLYLQARYLQRRATEEDYLYSRELLQRAVVRDPSFALAYAWLGGTYAMMVTDGLERPTDGWPQVNRYIGQALQIDPDLPEAHAISHAVAFLFDWDWAGAERIRKRLMQFPLGDFDPHTLRAIALEHWALGRPEEALSLARRTRELDPRSSYLAILEADYLLRAGQLDPAVALYERATRDDPANPNAYFGLAEARFRQQRFDEALVARRQAHEAAGDDALDELFATARGERGYREIDRAWVRLQLEALKLRQATAYVSPVEFARVHAQLGDKETAFTYLDAAFIDRSPGLVFLKVDPAWDAIRDDPRLADAVRRVGLP